MKGGENQQHDEEIRRVKNDETGRHGREQFGALETVVDKHIRGLLIHCKTRVSTPHVHHTHRIRAFSRAEKEKEFRVGFELEYNHDYRHTYEKITQNNDQNVDEIETQKQGEKSDLAVHEYLPSEGAIEQKLQTLLTFNRLQSIRFESSFGSKSIMNRK